MFLRVLARIAVAPVTVVLVVGCRTLPPPPPSAASSSFSSSPGRLAAPFDPERRRSVIGFPVPDPPADPALALPPVVDLEGVSYYADAAKSLADPTLQQQNREALAPLRGFVAALVSLADGWMASRPPNPAPL